jgi:polyhydroxyalkanoate synthase
MPDYAIANPQVMEQTVDDGRSVRVHTEEWSWPKTKTLPPLAAIYTAPASGPVRATVVLVHGLAQNRHTWQVSQRSLPAFFAEPGLATLNLELRGHGRSRALGAGNAAAFCEYVQDIERVAQSLSTPPFVIGHSLGAAAAIGAATVTPLAGVIHLAGVYGFATANPVLRGMARVSVKAESVLRHARVRVSTGWAGDVLGRLYSLTDIAGYGLPLAGWVPGSIQRTVLEERLRTGFDWTSLEVWLELCSWARGVEFPYAEAFRETNVPLFVLSGDADPLARPMDARPCFDDAATDDKTLVVLEPFEYETHWGHLDIILGDKAPSVVWPLLTNWLLERS